MSKRCRGKLFKYLSTAKKQKLSLEEKIKVLGFSFIVKYN